VSASYQQGPEFGAQFHGMWSSYTDEEREDILSQFQESNIRTVRLDVSWAMLQPHDSTSYDPWGVDFVDRVIAMINAHDMSPLITLWLTPDWANGGQGDRVLPTDPGDYARVAQWAAQRYAGKVAGWEVWNEPNLNDFMVGADPVAYVRLLRAAYPAFKLGDPNTYVVFGGVSYNDDTWISAAYDAGAQGFFDVMATHPYMGVADLPPGTPDDGTMWTLNHAVAVRQLMEARGDMDKSLWFTECGWSTHDNEPGTPNWGLGVAEETQAQYLTEMMDLIRATMPWVGKVYWYAERDSLAEGGTHNQNYGLVRTDHSAKPALNAACLSTMPPALA
jgi:hypothetical protein